MLSADGEPAEGATPLRPPALVGRWRLTRRLVDHRRGQSGCLHGTLVITADLEWIEEGVLRWGAHQGPARRRLRLVERADGWWVTFADGRAFHPWQPGAPVRHDCGADLYRGLVTGTADRMHIRWLVTGPAKDQRLESRLRRG